jgi:hypothetical protein
MHRKIAQEAGKSRAHRFNRDQRQPFETQRRHHEEVGGGIERLHVLLKARKANVKTSSLASKLPQHRPVSHHRQAHIRQISHSFDQEEQSFDRDQPANKQQAHLP